MGVTYLESEKFYSPSKSNSTLQGRFRMKNITDFLCNWTNNVDNDVVDDMEHSRTEMVVDDEPITTDMVPPTYNVDNEMMDDLEHSRKEIVVDDEYITTDIVPPPTYVSTRPTELDTPTSLVPPEDPSPENIPE